MNNAVKMHALHDIASMYSARCAWIALTIPQKTSLRLSDRDLYAFVFVGWFAFFPGLAWHLHFSSVRKTVN